MIASSGTGTATTELPLVSIVTPTLNQAAFIEQTIRSIEQQTYLNIEHIVIDGGSTDATGEILARRQPSQRLRWRSEPDRGMYDALNKGLSMAHGQILGYLNSDDVYTPWAVESAVRALAEAPGTDVVLGDGLTVDSASGRQRISFIPPFDAGALARVGSLVQPAVFWRRRILDRFGGFDADLRFVGDLEYWLRIGPETAVIRVDEVLAVERLHDAALSRASADAMATEESTVRSRFKAGTGWPARVSGFRARARAAWWRRRLWWGFLMASRQPAHTGRGWDRFLADGDVHVSAIRTALAFVPRLGAPFAWDAVTSGRPWFESPSTSEVAASHGISRSDRGS